VTTSRRQPPIPDLRDAERSPGAKCAHHTRPALVALAVAVCLSLVACGTSAPAVTPASAIVGTLVDTPTPDPILRLPLTTSDGRTITLSSFHGDFLVLCDVMTLGQETSPVDTAALVRAARAVQEAGLGDRVRFLSVTIDPQRDTPARLAAYRRLYPDPPADWTLLTGSPGAIGVLWDHFGVHRSRTSRTPDRAVDWMTSRPLTYTVVHNDQVHFLDRTYDDRFVLQGPANVRRSGTLPTPLDTFLDDHGRRDLKDPALNDWTTRQVLNVVGWLTARSIPSPSDG
jgi:protein SCO1/2